MKHDIVDSKPPYQMEFDVATIKHLGFQMYSTLPQVIGELVANAWDANATQVEISIPDTLIDEDTSEIVIIDNGIGMSDTDVREKYLRIGRDRRGSGPEADKTPPPQNRKVMGRKGIGKFSAFGIAKEIGVESVKDGEVSHFRMNYEELIAEEDNRSIEFDPLSPTSTVHQGTKITLKYITKYKTSAIPIGAIRRGLARRFAVIGAQHAFEVIINDEPISIDERDLKSKLARDLNGEQYIWEYDGDDGDGVEIKKGTGWKVSGWIGALSRTSQEKDKIVRGIVLMARGKLVQDPFLFDAVVGQQFALSYLIGELHVDFVDAEEDTIATTRNSLVWDTEANAALKEWGKDEVNKNASLWAKRRSEDNKRKLQEHPLYLMFQKEADKIDKKQEFEQADRLVQRLILDSVDKNLNAEINDFEPMIQMFLEFWRFDSFREMAKDIKDAEIEDPNKLLKLFREWEILEAKEMSKITKGRITTIERLQELIDKNCLEKPILHDFLKEFPWVIDPRWTLIADEISFSKVLREHFPEDKDVPEENRRIDFLCVSEGTNLAVVEIKRPNSRISHKELDQIAYYVDFMKTRIQETSDHDYKYSEVTGYILCGGLVNDNQVKVKAQRLARTQIYVRQYRDLLRTVRQLHDDFLDRYEKLKEAKQAVNFDS